MADFFGSLSKVIHTSIILAVILFLFLSFGSGGFAIDQLFWSWLFRYFHVVAGIMWIGLLYYFNFVQVPNMSKITDEQKPAITKVIAPSALFWFRWAAFVTVVTGLIVAYLNGYAHEAMTLGIGSGGGVGFICWCASVEWIDRSIPPNPDISRLSDYGRAHGQAAFGDLILLSR